MQTLNPSYRGQVEALFRKAAFLEHLGIRLKDCGPGWCESEMEVQAFHRQQDQVMHAGVMATLADHTAGGAGATLIKPEEIVLTVEFKINLLRPAKGERLRAKSTVLKPGRTLSIVESSVYSWEAGEEKLSAKAMVTLAIVPRRS